MAVLALPIFFKILFLEGLLTLVLWYATADGLKDSSGTPLGADFINVYAAGLLANAGSPEAAYNWGVHREIEQSVMGYAGPYFAWHYPPMFLAVAMLTATVPYLWAFALYLAGGFAGYLSVFRRIVPQEKGAFWAIVAFPGVYANIINGQNGFITTALLGTGLLALEKRPWLAGICFGFLAYKPQFFLVVPLMLMAGGYGRACFSALASAAVIAGSSWAVFGSKTWQAFFESMELTQHHILERGLTGWNKIQTVFSMVRMWGGDVSSAYIAQGACAVFALAAAALVWRHRAPLAIRAAALVAAILLSTPYAMDYDLVVLAVPIALLIRQGAEKDFRSFDKILLVCLWCLPMLARLVGSSFVPLTPPLMFALLALSLRRMREPKQA